MLILASVTRRIMYLSHAYYGSAHDYAILKTEFSPDEGVWFEGTDLYLDLGFLGIKKDYTESAKIPHKKTKGKQLTEEQKKENREISSIRIKVEHSIGGMKRYNILSERSRIKSIIRYNQVCGICAGLWNYCITC